MIYQVDFAEMSLLCIETKQIRGALGILLSFELSEYVPLERDLGKNLENAGGTTKSFFHGNFSGQCCQAEGCFYFVCLLANDLRLDKPKR